MRYRGQIGELKPWGFAISIALCLAFALFAYSRFSFVMEPRIEVKAGENDVLKRVSELEAQVSNLKTQLALLKKEKQPVPESKHKK